MTKPRARSAAVAEAWSLSSSCVITTRSGAAVQCNLEASRRHEGYADCKLEGRTAVTI